MRFHPLTPGPAEDAAVLASEYKAARVLAGVRLGELRLYFRAGLRTWYIPYREVRRVFRRVQLMPTGTRRQKRDVRLESLVICGEAGELAQVQMPGESAAKELMAALEERIPEAEFGKPAD